MRNRLLAIGLVLVAACEGSEPVTVPVIPPSAPAPPGPVASANIGTDHSEFFVGGQGYAVLEAYDARGRVTDAATGSITSSNADVVSLSSPVVIQVRGADLTYAKGLLADFTAVGVGTAIIRATINGIEDSVSVKVLPQPIVTSALAVDSFTVIEHRAVCAWNCPYLVYAPLLKLRAGSEPVNILSLKFELPGMNLGLCTTGTSVVLGAHEAMHLNPIDEYLWNNDMIHVQLNGVPLPDGLAKATVTYRSSGKEGTIEIEAELQRLAPPQYPSSRYLNVGWSCDRG